MKTVVVDASVWVSAILPDEPNHATSQAWVDRWRRDGNQFAQPSIFVTEVGCAIGRRRQYATLATPAVADILVDGSIEFIAVDRAIAESAADIGIPSKLRGADAIYVALAKQRGIPIVTWDNEILSSASKVGVTARVPTV